VRICLSISKGEVNMMKKSVLIIEDESELATIILNMLETYGLEGEIVDTSRQATKLVKKSDYDFFIIDLSLPDSSGIDLYNSILSINDKYKGKVVFTSGLSVDEELDKIIQSDGALFLPKPFTIDKFKEIIGKVV
jgi:DNA-binding NtrC family response regulator